MCSLYKEHYFVQRIKASESETTHLLYVNITQDHYS